LKTIIGFDSWTAGAHHFDRLVPALERRGYRLLLIHIGSWGHDKGRPAEEYIGKLHTRDISYYQGKPFPEILDLEKASGIIFLSTRAFAHMAFNRYAKCMGIPTCHLYHGLVTVQAVNTGEIAYKTNLIRHLSLVRERAAKNVCRLIPLYLNSLIHTRAPLACWKDLLTEVVTKAFHGYPTANSLQDIKTDIGCVYTAADFGHIQRSYDIASENIHVVGNPDLMHFGMTCKDFAYALDRSDRSSEIIYIDTALVEQGLCFDTVEDFLNHLKSLQMGISSMGFSLVVKLHPAHRRNNVSTKLEEFHITLCESHAFIERLKMAEAVITEPSSAALIPALMGLPLLLCQCGRLKDQAYGEVLTSYPRSRFLTRPDDLRAILDDERRTLNVSDVRNWIQENAGPLPPEEMPNRVASAIDDMVQKNTPKLDGR